MFCSLGNRQASVNPRQSRQKYRFLNACYFIRSMTVHRASCLAVLNTDLEKVDYANNGPDSPEKLYLSSHDHGATFFNEATKSDPTEPDYMDRLGLAVYLTEDDKVSKLSTAGRRSRGARNDRSPGEVAGDGREDQSHLLTVDRAYVQVLQATVAKKMISIIARYTSYSSTDVEHTACRKYIDQLPSFKASCGATRSGDIFRITRNRLKGYQTRR